MNCDSLVTQTCPLFQCIPHFLLQWRSSKNFWKKNSSCVIDNGHSIIPTTPSRTGMRRRRGVGTQKWALMCLFRGCSLPEILNYVPDGGHFFRIPMSFQIQGQVFIPEWYICQWKGLLYDTQPSRQKQVYNRRTVRTVISPTMTTTGGQSGPCLLGEGKEGERVERSWSITEWRRKRGVGTHHKWGIVSSLAHQCGPSCACCGICRGKRGGREGERGVLGKRGEGRYSPQVGHCVISGPSVWALMCLL